MPSLSPGLVSPSISPNCGCSNKGRPGLCDVPALQNNLVVFTRRETPSAFYQSFVAGKVRLDIRRFKASDVIAIAIPPERQDQQNVRKLAALVPERWERLVNLIDQNRNQAPIEEIAEILDIDAKKQEVEALAARSNMSMIVYMLHDRGSQLMDMLFKGLSEGKLCIVDVSQMRSGQAMILSGLVLRQIFDRNQEQFTAAEPQTIPTIAVIEEAQTVLNERASAAEPYIAWVKEGRKYDLGAFLITQQPGSIPVEILSQGDNWFIFHLLSSADLINLQRANAHFSEDLLSALLNEPIPGQGVFWSSVGGKPYPVPLRVLSFERMYRALDPTYTKASVDTFASKLRFEYQQTVEKALQYDQGISAAREKAAQVDLFTSDDTSQGSTDIWEISKQRAIDALGRDANLMQRIREEGVTWGQIKGVLKQNLPETFVERDQVAYNLVPTALRQLFGPEGEGWYSYREAGRLIVRAGRRPYDEASF